MRRYRIILSAIILAFLGAILPMLSAFWFAWKQTKQEEQALLMGYTNQMYSRTQQVIDLANQIVKELDELNPDIRCSSQHITEMRKISLSRMGNVLIGYFDNNIQLCNSFGLSLPSKIEQQKPDFVLTNGLGFIVNATPLNNWLKGMSAFSKGNYNLYFKPDALTNIIVPDTSHLAILFQGKVLSDKNPIDSTLLKNILNHEQLKTLGKVKVSSYKDKKLPLLTRFSKSEIVHIKKQFVSVSQLGPFLFIATSPEKITFDKFRHNQAVFLPFGLLAAIIIMFIVIHYSRKKLSFESEMLNAIKDHQFVVYYQPIVDSQTKKCSGAEALIRWKNDAGELVRPDIFIPIAEEAGLVPQLTDELIDIVFREMEDFLKNNPSLHISINACSLDIQSGRILEILEKKISESSVRPDQIWIEVTERSFVDLDKSNKVLKEAQSKGYVILVDDFGTGYSSLSYLQDLSVNFLKIDQSFVKSIGTGSVSSNVIVHIIEIAKELNLKLIAEGVETEMHVDYMKQYYVEYCQGYFFSKPIPADEFIQFVKNNQSMSS